MVLGEINCKVVRAYLRACSIMKFGGRWAYCLVNCRVSTVGLCPEQRLNKRPTGELHPVAYFRCYFENKSTINLKGLA